MKKRLFTAILAFAMVLCLCPVTARAVSDVPEGYIPVSTPEDLNAIRFDMNGKYFLTNDIDLTEALSKGGSLYLANGWAAIDEFFGIIDGNGHTITGFQSNQGFVGKNRGTIKNLTISGNIQNGLESSGGFARYNYGVILNCHNYVDIVAGAPAGGITGTNYEKVLACSNHGYIYSSATSGMAGGIVGTAERNSLISDCYNTGKIEAHGYSMYFTAYSYAGGILGFAESLSYAESSNAPKVVNSYNTGEIAYATSKGSLAGNKGSARFTNCYYNPAFCQYIYENRTGGNPLNEASMKDSRAFVGFDFDRVWTMGTGDYKYPVLTGACPHALNHVEATEPSCEIDGNLEYWYCPVCDKYFADGDAKQALDPYDIPVSGAHIFGEYISDGNATCTANGTKTAKCQNCDAVDTLEDEGSKLPHNYQDGTCTECGQPGGFHRGDIDRDGDVDVDDVLALLWYVLFPGDYPID